MSEHDIVIGIALEDAALTLEQLASACAVDRDWIEQRVHEGLLPSMPGPGTQWRFTAASLARVRRMRDLEHHFDAVLELAALVADLLEEMDALRSQLRGRGR